MNQFPDFCDRGYQIVATLGHNHLGGRVTYLANQRTSQQQVAIKQFQFAQLGSSWAAYDSYEQEIAILKRLNHPGIPSYLDCFQTADGFCMVQDYLQAESLARPRHWTPEQIKHIAVSVLDILVYLQAQTPPIIHRDLKPENILIDDQQTVSLIDFGFARLGGGDIAASSLVKGTVGFMPPEQLFNRQLTPASDLYGLGATLICLLTGTQSTKISSLLDERYGLHFQHLVPPLKRGWLSWLAKLVEPKPQDRYASATAALAALEPLDVNRAPRVRLSHDHIEITASQFGEHPTQSITISNAIPNTLLAGRWEVAVNDSDPPHTPYDHAWIAIEPSKFEGNELRCQITVNTRKLQANRVYQRMLVLQSNGSPERYEVPVQLQTAPAPAVCCPPYRYLFGLSCLVFVIPWLLFWVALTVNSQIDFSELFFIGLAAGFSGAPVIDRFSQRTSEGKLGQLSRIILGSTAGLFIGFFLGGVCIAVLLAISGTLTFLDLSFNSMTWPWVAFLVALATASGTIVGASIGANERRFMPLVTVITILAIACLALAQSGIGTLIPVYVWLLFLAPVASGLTLQVLLRPAVTFQMRRGLGQRESVRVALLTVGLGISLNITLVATHLFLQGFGDRTANQQDQIFLGLLAIAPTALILCLLFKFLVLPHRKRLKAVAQYVKSQPALIRP